MMMTWGYIYTSVPPFGRLSPLGPWPAGMASSSPCLCVCCVPSSPLTSVLLFLEGPSPSLRTCLQQLLPPKSIWDEHPQCTPLMPARPLSLCWLFFFFFLAALQFMEFPGWVSDLSGSCDLSHSCSNAGSLTHCARLGSKPVRVLALPRCCPSHCVTAGTPVCWLFMYVFHFPN